MFELVPVRTIVGKLLEAYVGLFIKPFEQNLERALTAAATSVALAIILPVFILGALANRPVQEIGVQKIGANSLVIILIWVVATVVITKPEKTLLTLTLARNLSLVSSWIAVTVVAIIAVKLWFHEPMDLPKRLVIAYLALSMLFIVHTWFNLRPPRRQPPVKTLCMMACLLLSMGVLIWKVM